MEHEEIDFGVIPSSERYTLRSEGRMSEHQAEARRLERERIMELFEAIKADVYQHVPSGSDSVAVQEVFQRFEEAVGRA